MSGGDNYTQHKSVVENTKDCVAQLNEAPKPELSLTETSPDEEEIKLFC